MQIFMIDGKTRPSERWAEAFVDCKVLYAPFPPVLPEGASVCWISTDLPDWQDHVRQRTGAHRVVVHSRRPSDEEALLAFSVGSHGYCHSLSSVPQLRTIAATVAGGGLWVGADLMGRMVRTLRRAQPDEPNRPPHGFEDLTPREREVAVAVTTGAANKEIARQLGLSERTIKMHIGSIFKKLDVRDRVHLVLRMTEGGA
ncbi:MULTISPECIES: response regulator transcription factor [unclassified Thioalkalivibrio]|uniref:helix-turn-helix transcriptional regulator n=1 Tax=unclassified Thioalkalivibrio TaxID=2621013 RepID=UPI0003813C7C|nr:MULTISPECIES: response regulator transcription factor [unclassified Thioalkalivibrio]